MTESAASRAFVYAVTGSKEYLAELHRSISVLRAYSDLPIIVVTDSSRNEVDLGQLLKVPFAPSINTAAMAPIHFVDKAMDKKFDNKEASILIKTSLPQVLSAHSLPLEFEKTIFCYLDSDVFAVDASVNKVFDHFQAPLSFAKDHCTIDRFSPWAVRCTCREPGFLKTMSRKLLGQRTACSHLRQELARLFAIDTKDGNWPHWNGGLFLFNDEAKDFFRSWHENTLRCFADESFENRDQGSLIATVWQQGMANRQTLADCFNRLLFADDLALPPKCAFLHLLGKSSSAEHPLMRSVLQKALKASPSD